MKRSGCPGPGGSSQGLAVAPQAGHRGHRTTGVRVAAVTNSHELSASVEPHNCITSHFWRSESDPVSLGHNRGAGRAGAAWRFSGGFRSGCLASRGASLPRWWPCPQVQRQKGWPSLRVSVHITPRPLPPSATSKGPGDCSGPTWGTRLIFLWSGERINNFSPICHLNPCQPVR